MGYYQMGRRLYDPAIGRFMAVDPLFESFPTQSPYAYAFNSPMQWRDPTGMAPQKEKRRDRVQNFDMNEYWIGYGLLQKAISWLEDERTSNYFEEMNYRQNMLFLAQSFSSRLGECGGGGGVDNGQPAALKDINEVNSDLFEIEKNASENNREASCNIYIDKKTGTVFIDPDSKRLSNPGSNILRPAPISDNPDWECIAQWHSHWGKSDDDGGDILNNEDLYNATMNGITQIVDAGDIRMVILIENRTMSDIFYNQYNTSIDVQTFLDNNKNASRTLGENVQEGHIMRQKFEAFGGQIYYAIDDKIIYYQFPKEKRKKP